MSSASMRAVVIARPGGVESLDVREVPRPTPDRDQVLIRVRRSALNRADVLQRMGRYPAPPGAPKDIPGIELAGEVAACGPNVQRWREGDRVFGLVGGGAHAEYAVAHERALAAIPRDLSWDDAGAIPEAFITAHDALTTQASARPGDRVLVHAVASGVGLAAVQIARALQMSVYGTARTGSKLNTARELGMIDGADTSGGLGALATRVAEWTDGHGMDVVLDLAGGPYVAASIPLLALKGRQICIGTMAGADAELPVGIVLRNRLTIRGTVLRSRPLEERILATAAFEREIVPLLADARVRAVIDSRYPLADIGRAHERMESNTTVGKIVIEMG
jgi:NADPH2:quinone reductase